MKLIQGYVFKANKNRLGFKAGNTYRIYHISKVDEDDKTKFKYFFNSSEGMIEEIFESTEQAEAIITKLSGR